MSDNTINTNTTQLIGENPKEDNSRDMETENNKNLPTPPTQIATENINVTSDEINVVPKEEDDKSVESGEKLSDDTEPVTDEGDVKDVSVEEDVPMDTESTDKSISTSADNNTCSDDADLKAELSSDNQQSDSKNDDSEKVDNDQTVNEGACGNSASSDDKQQPDGSVHQVKWVYFKKKQVPVITQNENGPCPLIALMNVLLLQNRVTLPQQTEYISAGQLMHHLGDSVLQNVPGEDGVSTPSRLNFEQNMGDAMAVMYKLQTGLDVNVKFTGVRDFEYTSECIIFDLLQIPLYHGWLVDPQNSSEVEALGKCSYNQLVEKIIIQKTSDQPDLVSQGMLHAGVGESQINAILSSLNIPPVNHSLLDKRHNNSIEVSVDAGWQKRGSGKAYNSLSALVAEEFLENTASQLTYHGLSELCTQLKEDELAVMFRNNHFTTLYRNKGELFQLVTDQGFLNESNVVWETLCNVEGDCHFVDSEFRTYTKPEPPPLSREPPSVPVNSEEQIDQDYLVALSLQQEQQQQQQPAEQMAWPTHNTSMSDEELAKQLQEEERRAALAEENEAQRRQGGQQPPRQQSQQTPSQRRPARSPSQSNKDDKCCIL